uniref:hypothetical protein n=1 Tax=Chromobacterium haemolyticum TaxID=394935 RepID=UPI00307EE0FA
GKNGSDGWSAATAGLEGNLPYLSVPAGARDSVYGTFFPVQGGDEFLSSFEAKWIAGGTSGTTLGLYFVDDPVAPNQQTWLGCGYISQTTIWTKIDGAIRAPSWARYARVWWQRNGFGADCGEWRGRNLSIRRRNTGNLIVDGAITTDKVAANAVTADKIAANQITATHIVVGSLTGDRLAANSITGDKVQAGAITANHIDSRGLTIKDTAGNIIFGAGQNLDVNRVAGLGSLARKSQVAASDMAVGQLSAITANIGEVTAGIMYSNDRQKYFNLDPSRSPAMMYVPGAVQINFDGSGFFARTIVSAPDVRASGVAWVSSGWVGGSGTWTTFIDTGVNLPSGWSTASSDMFQASATIAGGNSQSGGAMGYTSVEVVHGDGLLAGAANSPIDNRMYIKFTWNGAGTSGGVINITRIDWKLVRV